MQVPLASQRINSVSRPNTPLAINTTGTETQALLNRPDLGKAITGAGSKVQDILQKRELVKMKEQNDILINDSKSSLLNSTNTFLSDPKDGVLNRRLQGSMGSTKETQDFLDNQKIALSSDLSSPYAMNQFNAWFDQHSNTTLNTVAKYENKQIGEADNNSRVLVRQGTIQAASLMPDDLQSVDSYYEQGLGAIKEDGDEALNKQSFNDDYYSAVILSGVDDSAKNSKMRFDKYEEKLTPKIRETLRQRISKSVKDQREVNIAQEAFNKFSTASDLAYQEIDKMTEDQEVRKKARSNYNTLRNQEEIIKKESVIAATDNLMKDLQNRLKTNTLNQNLNLLNAEIEKKISGTGGVLLGENFYPDNIIESVEYTLENPEKAFKITDIEGSGKYKEALLDGSIKDKNDLLGYLPYLSPIDKKRAESEIKINSGDYATAEFGVNPKNVDESYKSMTGWGGNWFGSKSDLLGTNYKDDNYHDFTNFVYEQSKDRKDLSVKDYNDYASSYFGKKVDEQKQKNIKIVGEAYNKPIQPKVNYIEGTIATNPTTGEKLIRRNGTWIKQ